MIVFMDKCEDAHLIPTVIPSVVEGSFYTTDPSIPLRYSRDDNKRGLLAMTKIAPPPQR